MDEYALAAQGPDPRDVAQQLIDGLGWGKQAVIRSGALATHARIVNETAGVWIGVTGGGGIVQLFAGRVDMAAVGPYRDPVPGTESPELSPDGAEELVEAARAVVDRVLHAKQ